MELLKVKKALSQGPVKVYGEVKGDSGKVYKFAYIRRANFRGWICACESFMLRLFAIKRNCKHLRMVREAVGRYGQQATTDGQISVRLV